MENSEPYYLVQGNVYGVPITHYNMEMSAAVRLAFQAIKPACVAVEFAETMELQLLHAASRLPDISVVRSYTQNDLPVYYLCEPCEPCFEGLRSALEAGIPAKCIDLDVDSYPEFRDSLPDPYAIQRIGLKAYYEAFEKLSHTFLSCRADIDREMYMAKRLKELSLTYDSVLFVGGMTHIKRIFSLINRSQFPVLPHAKRNVIEVCTLTEKSCREVCGECGWMLEQYERVRDTKIPDRQMLLYQLLKEASQSYKATTGNPFPHYHMRNLLKFMRNYALATNRLMPDLFQLISSAKCCVDHNYAYEVWELATGYVHLRNIDQLEPLELSIEDIWKGSKIIRFHKQMKNPKSLFSPHRQKNRSKVQFSPPSPFGICSYPPEDIIIEKYGEFLKKKGTQILNEESARTVPFSTTIEDGIDARETIRHWHEKKLYVKTKGKPPGSVGSVVMIFDEEQDDSVGKKYSWCTTWIGEHSQESDMAFYATTLTDKVVGPGISRCEYGGFMMSYPPRRLFDVWSDPDYTDCRTKAEVLLKAAIDYSMQTLISYVAHRPPRSAFKSYAARFGKKIVYIPIGQLSSVTLNKLRVFHVLDGHDTRRIADEYIF